MKCENCDKDHNGIYGSGRFCNEKCARSFSTKNKRKEINNKVSKSLKNNIPWHKNKKIKLREISKCIVCGESFEHIKGKNRKSCYNGICSKHVPKKGSGGLRDGGGRSKVFLYESEIAGNIKLNKDEISVAKVFDKLKLQWERNKKGFEYINLQNKKRKYYPDFYIKNYDVYVEYKGWITNEMDYKMTQAKKINNIKLLIIYGNDKRYRNLGLNLNQINENPNFLINKLTTIF